MEKLREKGDMKIYEMEEKGGEEKISCY